MKTATPARPDSRGIPAANQPGDRKSGKTPNADMQAEDAGTGDSGADSGTAASHAMKQTSKTAAESGTKR